MTQACATYRSVPDPGALAAYAKLSAAAMIAAAERDIRVVEGV